VDGQRPLSLRVCSRSASESDQRDRHLNRGGRTVHTDEPGRPGWLVVAHPIDEHDPDVARRTDPVGYPERVH
jgi:hypothetical protein